MEIKSYIVALYKFVNQNSMYRVYLTMRYCHALCQLDPSVDLSKIARDTEGLSGSDLQELSRSAAIFRVREFIRSEQSNTDDGSSDSWVANFTKSKIQLSFVHYNFSALKFIIFSSSTLQRQVAADDLGNRYLQIK